MAKQHDAVAKLKALPGRGRQQFTWFNRLSKNAQDEFIAIAKAYNRGEFSQWSARRCFCQDLQANEHGAISKELADALQAMSYKTIENWLEKFDDNTKA